MKRQTLVLLLATCVLGLSVSAYGAGFLIYEHGAAAMAMAGAFVSIANNPSAVFHNPAGLAFLEGTQVSLGTTLIFPRGSLELANWPDSRYRTVKQENQIFYPTTFYITHRFGEKLAAGFGFFSPYGLGTKWPKDYPLRYLATSNDMKTFFFNPVIAYKASDSLSFGVGFSYIHSTLKFDLVQPLLIWDVPTSLDTSGSAFGFNAGALYKKDKLSLGVNWRSGFDIKYSGDIKLDSSNVPSAYKVFVPAAGDVSTKFHFPHILGVGVSYFITPKLLLALDVHYVLWSTFDKYVVKTNFSGAEEELESVEDWEDAFTFRLGGQYSLNEKWNLRAGFLYDQTPQPVKSMDPTLPDANRAAFTGGFGCKWGRWVIDFGCQFEFFSDRTCPNRNIYALLVDRGFNAGEGTYSTKAYLFGISLSYLFKGKD
jgi:long-chain fatty acid transport protein